MNILIKILLFSLVMYSYAYAGAYRDVYEVEIGREIIQIQNKIDQGTASAFEIKKKIYLEKRVKALRKRVPQKLKTTQ